jgi:hypothetical protein
MRYVCGPVAHMRPWRRLLVALLACGLLVQGCSLFAKHHQFPAQPLRPTIVGVVASETHDATGYHARLVDGQVADQPQNGTYRLMGGDPEAGTLLLVGTDDGGFWVQLSAIGNGCWEASDPDDSIVWDMGDSVVFSDGLELPKAAGFRADVQPETVDGRLGWPHSEGDGPSQMSFCANSKGQIESGKQRS